MRDLEMTPGGMARLTGAILVLARAIDEAPTHDPSAQPLGARTVRGRIC